MVFSKSSLLATALVAMSSVVSAQSNSASYDQVAQIQLTFPAADLTPVPVPANWLDIQGVLNVTFGDVAVSNIGDKLTVAQVQSAPSFRISAQTPAASSKSVFGEGKLFTIAFLDAGVAGKNTSTEVFNHYLGNNFTIDASSGELRNQTGARVNYGAPLPATNDGPHRYMQLNYYQQANGGLGKIVAANYIQIEVGQAAAPSSTAPVSQASVTALAASKSSAAGGKATGSTSGSASGATNSSGGNASAAASSLASVSIAGIVAMGSAALLGAAML
ncbi:predicted membrane proteins [Moesziomyces antarcticus T-34]|uniref:Predicted membrane proteins n=1 Tax=Pseudozyma antarctica (strain T-34) TaxID=1151754 RepID=M9M0U5_PSEA3|nr:predicted membrane proteins [Moesziomyces antarcticus T-34]